MRRHLALLLLVTVAGLWIAFLATGGTAMGQSAPGGNEKSNVRQIVDLRKGIYEESHILGQIPRALPAYVAGGLAIILLAHFLGFFEMGLVSILVLLAAIGGIVYKFYWSPGP